MNKDPFDQPTEVRDIFGQFSETVPEETPVQRPVVKEQPVEQPVVAPQEQPGIFSRLKETGKNLKEINKALEVGAARGFGQEWFDEYLSLQPAIKKYVESGFSLEEAKKAIAEELPKIREEQKALEEAHPYATGVGKFVGSIPPMLVAPVGKGAKWLYDVGYGGLFGGLTGAGEAEEDKATAGALGAGLGAGTTAAFLGAGKVLKTAYDRTLKPGFSALNAYFRPQAAAEKKLINTLIQDQQDIAAGKLQGIDWDQWTKLRDNGEPVTIADLGGPRTQALIKDLVKNDPEKAAQLTRFFEDRFKTQYERIGNDIRYITGSEANAGKTSDQILAEYDAKRFPAYQKAYSNPNAEFMYDKELQNYVNSFKDPKGSSKFISDAIRNGYDEAVKQAVFNNRPRPEYYSLEHWDYIRREISKDSGAWKKAEELNKILDAKVPEYKEARGLVTNYFGEKNALEAGQRFAEKKIRIEDLQKTLRKMSPEELELFREGYASNLSNNVIKNIKEGVDVNNALFGKPAQKEQLLAVFGEEGLNKIKDRMTVESIYQNTNKAFKIPASSYKDFILAGLTGGAITGYESGWDPGFIIGGVSAGAFLKKALAQEMTKRGVKFLNRESADILSRLLTSQDPADMRKAYDLLSKNPQARTALKTFSNAVQRAAALAVSQEATKEPKEKMERAPWLEKGQEKLEPAPWLQGKARGGSVTDKMHMANGGTPFAGSSNPNKVYNPITKRFELIDPKHWTKYDKTWNSLNNYQKAAVMSLMEADKTDPEDAKNILGAIVNRAARSKEDLGTHVSKKIYQPTFEPTQRARLNRLLKHPALPELIDWVERRSQGLEPDNVGGATHYLAPETVMLALERKNPKKYKNWGPRGQNWTGFDTKTGSYRNVTMRDKSHAFLAPEGKYSAPYVAPQQVAGEIPPILQSQTRNDRARLAQMTEEASKPTQVASEIPPILQSQTHEERDRARLAQLADEAAQPTQTATVPEKNKELSPDDYAKFLQAIQGFMKGQEQLPAPVAPLPQAPKPEIPIVRPYGMAQGGTVTDRMHQARKKKEVGGSTTAEEQPLKERGTFVPLGVTQDDKVQLAWPSVLYEPAQAWKRMVDRGAIDLNNPEAIRQQAQDAFNVAGSVGTGSYVATPLKPAGAAGLFGGEIAAKRAGKTIDLYKAKIMDMAGASREKIWEKTGFWKNPNDQWMFEISDKDAALTIPEYVNKGRDPETEEYLRKNVEGRLKEQLSHPEAYKIFPELGETGSTYMREVPHGEAAGEFQPYTGFVKHSGETPSTALHEMQHFIDKMEGRPFGANPEKFIPPPKTLKEAQDYMHLLGASYNLKTAKDPEKYINELRKIAILRKQDPDNYVETIQKLAGTVDEKTMANWYGKLKYETKEKPYEMYAKNYGEALARLVQKRRNMTPEERAANPPWMDFEKVLPESGMVRDFPERELIMPSKQSKGGSVTHKMHQARKKKVDGGSATSDDMTWSDVAEQYKQNIGPDVEKQATNYLLQQYQAYKDPLGTLKSAGQGLYNVGKGAYDIGVGLGSKALGSLDYEPTGDVKYHRELPLEKAIEGVKNFDVKKYIAEHPAEATSQGLGLATGVGALGRKVAMSPLTREFLANESGSVPLGKTSGIKGYHGSPHSFEKFDASKIGTGEGAQAYGHGLYFAESEPVAKNYYNNLTYKKIRNDFLDALPEDADFSEVTSLLGTKHFTPQQEDLIKALKKDDWFGFDYPSQAINAALNRKQNLVDMFDASPETVEAVKNLGNMYEVNIKAEPHQFIDLDKTLSEQPEMSEVISSMANLTKEQQEKLPMKDVLKLLGRPKEVSEKFHKAGIQGYKYFDALSREKGEGNRNYVVFNPEIVDVLRKYEKGGSVTEKMLWRKKRSKKH